MPRALVVGAILLGGISHLSAQSDVLATLGTNAREANDSIFMTLTTGLPTLAGERAVRWTSTPRYRCIPDKTLRFVNPVYESRSKEWKMCFRAGKPAVEAARAAADEWLKTLTP